MAKAGSNKTRSTKSARVNGKADDATSTAERGRDIFPLQFIKGVGPARASALAEIGVRTVRDLLMLAPRAYLDRRTVLPLRTTKLLLGGEEGVPDQITVV